ncbi:DNA double-strand break repair nuclease NurA [Candidatus Micrarchaeota archaeon]|nr:DNA double-strand break repair nuclease NurA [Candidatus Micrarchaeota archaeon]
MKDQLSRLASQIKENEKIISSQIAQLKAKEAARIFIVGSAPISLSVCAVDGGLISFVMHGMDINIVRAAAVNFSYAGSVLKTHNYYPEKHPEPMIEFRNALDEHEANVFRSLVRLKHELGCAISAIEKFRPNILLIDGSLVLLPTDRPPSVSELYPLYEDVVALYQTLFDRCKILNCQLLGIIKDSRSRKLSKTLGMNCSDSLLCNYLLGAGERTEIFTYEDRQNKGSQNHTVKFFYIKPSSDDIPLRVEFLEQNLEQTSGGDHIASLVQSLSAISSNFAYPAILIEADLCAALDDKDADLVKSFLPTKSLRRNLRPFR